MKPLTFVVARCELNVAGFENGGFGSSELQHAGLCRSANADLDGKINASMSFHTGMSSGLCQAASLYRCGQFENIIHRIDILSIAIPTIS